MNFTASIIATVWVVIVAVPAVLHDGFDIDIALSFRHSLACKATNILELTLVRLGFHIRKCLRQHTSKVIFSFFDGLIPEGWLLGVVTRNWKIPENDRFGVLLAACKDPIGNVSIREERI